MLFIRKRFVKMQQMRWTRRGVHLLLQVRTRVLDDTLTITFQRWYLGMRETSLANKEHIGGLLMREIVLFSDICAEQFERR
jgi:hypothetical protein